MVSVLSLMKQKSAKDHSLPHLSFFLYEDNIAVQTSHRRSKQIISSTYPRLIGFCNCAEPTYSKLSPIKSLTSSLGSSRNLYKILLEGHIFLRFNKDINLGSCLHKVLQLVQETNPPLISIELAVRSRLENIREELRSLLILFSLPFHLIL